MAAALLALLASPARAATYTAASCNQSDVNAVINGPAHVALDGDTIMIPAGTCTWTSGISVPAGIGISIIGAGTTDPHNPSGSGQTTTLIDNYTVNPGNLFYFRPHFGASLSRLSSMTLSPQPGLPVLSLGPPIALQGTCAASGCPNVRVDHLLFPASPSWAGSNRVSSTLIVADNVFGVLDHNSAYVDDAVRGYYEFLNFNHSAWQGIGQYGDNSWANPNTFGTNQSIYVEANYFETHQNILFPVTESEGGFGYENWGGGRVVCRFNTGVGLRSMCVNHGTESGGRMRGGRQMEFYKNSMSCPSSAYPACWNNGMLLGAGTRSGSLLSLENRFSGGGINSFTYLVAYRTLQSFAAFGACDGTGLYDNNDPTTYFTGTIAGVGGSNPYTITVNGSPTWTANQWVNNGAPYSVHDATINNGSEITGSGSNTLTVTAWTSIPYAAGDTIQIRRAYACIDQSSRIGGTLLSGLTPTPDNSSVGWRNQTPDPVYEAADTLDSGSPVFGAITAGTARIIANRDYYGEVSQSAQTSPTAPFNGTAGTGYGTLANRPTTCSKGVGYWATDQGTWNQSGSGGQGQLYVCSAPNTWTLYYTPYTYPHPLTTGSPGPRTYTVKKDGTGDFTTIQACANAMAAGDTCSVYAGTYNENVTVPAGSAASYKTLAVNGADVVNVLSFALNSDIKISGFHIQNPASPNTKACVTLLANSRDVYITSNVITQCGVGNSGGGAMIWTDNGTGNGNVYIQGNTLSYGCGTPSAPDSCNAMNLFGDHYLVENNDISHVLFGADVAATYTVIRNNKFHDMNQSECTSHPGCHMDVIFSEPGSNLPAAYNVWEGNQARGISGSDSHGFLAQGDACAGNCHHLIVRYNDLAHLGSGGLIDDNSGKTTIPGFSYVKSYNNDWVDLNNYPPNQLYGATNGFANNSTQGADVNDLFYYPESLLDFNPYFADAGSVGAFSMGHNLAYCSASPCNLHGHIYGRGSFTDDSGNQINDPKFVNYAANDFRLAAGSPAIGMGTSLTTVAAGDSGSGTSLVVADASYFQDGYGLAGVQADWIRVGPTATAQIVSINYNTNTLTLANSVSRKPGDPVFLFKDSSGRQVLFGTNPDIGAYPFAAGGASACDVNADAQTNVVDVQQTVNQALGLGACLPAGQAGTADINKDGKCDVIDVQRVVNAALGGACVAP